MADDEQNRSTSQTGVAADFTYGLIMGPMAPKGLDKVGIIDPSYDGESRV